MCVCVYVCVCACVDGVEVRIAYEHKQKYSLQVYMHFSLFPNDTALPIYVCMFVFVYWNNSLYLLLGILP